MTNLVNRTDYFAAAMRLLGEEGPAALKVGRLCAALGVTTGSFYHHFASQGAFVAELLDHWEQQETEQYVAMLDAVEDPEAGIAVIRESALALPHRAEAALRAWSHSHPEVATVQARVDQRRLEAVARVVQRLVEDAERATRLALLALVMLAGFQVARRGSGTEELGVLLDEFFALLVPARRLAAD